MVDLARDGSAPSGPATDPGTDQPVESSPVSGAGKTMRLIATIGSPIAIATGLLFYFGWVRASVQAKQLGYDTAILDWSVQDHILRSILVLFIPLMLLIALMLLLTWLRRAVSGGCSAALPSPWRSLRRCSADSMATCWAHRQDPHVIDGHGPSSSSAAHHGGLLGCRAAGQCCRRGICHVDHRQSWTAPGGDGL